VEKGGLFAIKNFLNGGRFLGAARPAGGPPPYKTPPTRIQKLFAPKWYKARGGGGVCR
jgi:hypothetical protein